MARIAKFYEKLPKGTAPDRATGGLLGRYQARYMGKNPSAARKSPVGFWIHAIDSSTGKEPGKGTNPRSTH